MTTSFILYDPPVALVNAHSSLSGATKRRAANKRAVKLQQISGNFFNYATESFQRSSAADAKSSRKKRRVVDQPALVVFKGNSDPFDALTVPIDATANHLIVFYNSHFTSWTYSLESGASPRTSYHKKTFNSCVSLLSLDSCAAYATLASLATSLRRLVGDSVSSTRTLEYKSKAYNALGARLGQALSKTKPRTTLVNIFALFRMELRELDFKAASVHARAIQAIVSEEARAGRTIEHTLLSACYWHDFMATIQSLDEENPFFPIFNPQPATEAQETSDYPHHLLLDVTGAASRTHSNGLPSSVERLLDPFRSSSVVSELGSNDVTTIFAIARPLMILYWDARRSLVRLKGSSRSLAHRHNLMMATSFAATYYLWCITNLDGLDLHKARALGKKTSRKPIPLNVVLRHFRKHLDTLEDYDRDERPGQEKLQPELLLWLHYVASVAEHAQIGKSAENGEPSQMRYRTYHNLQLVKLAMDLELPEWPQVEYVLSQYLYRPDLCLDSARNFVGAMSMLHGAEADEGESQKKDIEDDRESQCVCWVRGERSRLML